MSSFFADVVVLGAGIAGHTLASELVRLGFPGRVFVVDAEREAPYDRPPLSKEYLATGDEQVIHFPPLAAANVECWLGDPVIDIDIHQHVLTTASGRSLAWGRLVFATGATSRVVKGLETGGKVHCLRTLEDARGIRKDLESASSVILVGGGPIGLELAAFASGHGVKASVLDAARTLMGRSVPEVVSKHLYDYHQSNGVEFHLEAQIDRVEIDGSVFLRDGRTLNADVVVVGVGVVANDDLAKRSGIETRDGILVDERFQTNIPMVYAIGDVARICSSSNVKGVRTETWASARDQAVALAKLIIDHDGPTPKLGAPWFWSDQVGIFVQGAGELQGDTETVRGDMNSGSYSVLQWRSGVLVGVASVNSTKDFQLLRKAIGAEVGLDPHEVSNPNCNLKSLFKSLGL